MCAPRALGFVPSAVFRLYRGDNRIQDYSTKNRRVSGLGSGFGEPQAHLTARSRNVSRAKLALSADTPFWLINLAPDIHVPFVQQTAG